MTPLDQSMFENASASTAPTPRPQPVPTSVGTVLQHSRPASSQHLRNLGKAVGAKVNDLLRRKEPAGSVGVMEVNASVGAMLGTAQLAIEDGAVVLDAFPRLDPPPPITRKRMPRALKTPQDMLIAPQPEGTSTRSSTEEPPAPPTDHPDLAEEQLEIGGPSPPECPGVPSMTGTTEPSSGALPVPDLIHKGSQESQWQVVTLYGVFTNHYSANGPSRCLLLELLDISVSELLLHSSNQGCSMWMIQHCARDVLEALAFLHHKGYVHADLKPRNILWSAEEECFKLIDFGLSFKEGNQDVKYIQTDGYRAPEAELQNCLAQAGLQSETECTSAVDLWSLGIVLLEMFSGMKLKHTVQSQEWKTNSSAIIDRIFASEGVVNSAIPAYHLRDLIKSMLHCDQGKRASAEKALCSPFFSIPFAPHIEDLVMLPTPVLRLLNVLSDASLQCEEEYEVCKVKDNQLFPFSDILEDIREECQKYGPVVSLLIPKENPGKGQVFVEYANAGDSKAAQKVLTGKIFDGKFVVATFYPLSAYKRGYLYQNLL
ncbi:Serine/threonine-protein kinase Kist [Willisornis vidua]|uniref:Serine/threonine-protein kinase Kist n=1 Tax=Willisornis vidua TaxID=1566151 RepID=A0ABQ9CZN2_9PASS|nr:Serine/threonine-protein kinase Kist [Willisornis vidua]